MPRPRLAGDAVTRSQPRTTGTDTRQSAVSPWPTNRRNLRRDEMNAPGWWPELACRDREHGRNRAGDEREPAAQGLRRAGSRVCTHGEVQRSRTINRTQPSRRCGRDRVRPGRETLTASRGRRPLEKWGTACGFCSGFPSSLHAGGVAPACVIDSRVTPWKLTVSIVRSRSTGSPALPSAQSRIAVSSAARTWRATSLDG